MPNAAVAFSDFVVKVGGSALGDAFKRDLIELTVETDVRLPSMFTIVVQDQKKTPTDPALEWSDGSTFKLGAEVEIAVAEAAPSSAQPQTQTLMKGEITAVEPEFTMDGRVILRVRGYDKSHRLHRGRKTKTYLNMKDSDIASQLAGQAGLSADVDSTSETYKYLIQHNQTNMEFLLERAQRIGYQVYAAEGKLAFKKATATRGDGPAIEWGVDLLSFNPRISGAHQADTVKVKGWDPKQKQAITGQATPSAWSHQGGVSQSGGAAAKSAFGGAEEVVSYEIVSSAGEATKIAEGLASALSAEYVQAEGVGLGDPRIQAGKTLEIKGVGTKFSGKYYVTSTCHRLSPSTNRGYETTFYITGYEPYTVSRLVGAEGGAHLRYPLGVVVGVVTNNKDPDDMGRVKVKFPWLDDAQESNWARLASPMAGPERGLYALPEINDEVLVAFEHGNMDAPYVVGAVWNGKDKVPIPIDKALEGGKINQRIFKTRAGHQILFDDKQGEEKILIKTKAGHLLEMDDKSGSEKITLKDKSGNNSLVIETTSNKMTVKMGQGGVAIEAQGPVTVKSSTGDVSLEGVNIKMKAQAQCTIEGTAGVTVKNAVAQIALSGPTVNINNGALEVM